jgi:hypothetical protein
MNSKVPPRLSRLLGEYERLTRDEAVALRTRDFIRLAEVHAFKPLLLEAIIGEGTSLGLDRRVIWFNDCLLALTALEKENLSAAARGLMQLSVQRTKLESARKRLRGLGHAYRGLAAPTFRLLARS